MAAADSAVKQAAKTAGRSGSAPTPEEAAGLTLENGGERPAAGGATSGDRKGAGAAVSMKKRPEREFRFLLKAHYTLVWVVTSEERRVERLIATTAQKEGYATRFWDCATGLTDLEGKKVKLTSDEDADTMPSAIFTEIRRRDLKAVWIMRDLPPWLVNDPVHERGLKTVARDLQDEQDASKLAVVVVLTSVAEVPQSLRGSTVVIDWPLPTREVLDSILTDVLKASQRQINGEREAVVEAAAGLTADAAADAFARSIVEFGRVDPGVVTAQKEIIINRERVLTWFPPEPRGLDAIGGLGRLKTWLQERRLALSPEARVYGLDAPKGVLIVGVPGCGKSLTAKAVPTAWGGLPLLRLDLGAMKGSLVGQSEANIRKALRVAEAVAPVVLWLEEIEKALAGSRGYAGDSGVASDQLGTILTWLQEREGTVFIVATANDVTALPPELTRKGRFDEIFFADLPTTPEREENLAVTLRKYGRDPLLFDLPVVARASKDFSGAEVAQLVPDALIRSFGDGRRELRTEDLLAVAATLVPISRSNSDQITALRVWAKSRARMASDPEPETGTASPSLGHGRVLDLGPGGDPSAN